jgi:hypothetical protein
LESLFCPERIFCAASKWDFLFSTARSNQKKERRVKIERHLIKTEKLSAFAKKHNLTMVVTERPNRGMERDKFYAMFKGIEVLKGTKILCGEFGNGYTETQAIREYAAAISGKTLIYDSMGKDRRQIEAPNLEP